MNKGKPSFAWPPGIASKGINPPTTVTQSYFDSSKTKTLNKPLSYVIIYHKLNQLLCRMALVIEISVFIRIHLYLKDFRLFVTVSTCVLESIRITIMGKANLEFAIIVRARYVHVPIYASSPVWSDSMWYNSKISRHPS